MKKHHNGAAAPAGASLGTQKMSLAPWAGLPFLTLPQKWHRRWPRGAGAHGGAGGALEEVRRCVLGGRAGLGFRRGLCPPPGLQLGRAWVATALSTLLGSTQSLPAHANVAVALSLSQLCFANQELCRQRSVHWTQVILRGRDGKGQMSVKWVFCSKGCSLFPSQWPNQWVLCPEEHLSCLIQSAHPCFCCRWILGGRGN